MNKIRVLIVEDDPMVAFINKNYTEAIEGFTVAGVAKTGKAALDFLQQTTVDLIILDIYLPQINGLEVLNILRREGVEVDVIVITAADDSQTVGQVLRHGVIAYIEKPFLFERYQTALEAYRNYFHKKCTQEKLDQYDIDRLFTIPNRMSNPEIPKNLSTQTLKSVMAHLKTQENFISAEEVALGVGISRGTARRYLEFLLDQGKVSKVLEYQSSGRPIHRFKVRQSDISTM